MSHSTKYALPRDIEEAKDEERVMKHVEGRLSVKDAWFDGEKARIREQISERMLKDFHMTLNRILVAVFVRPDNTDPVRVRGIILPTSYTNEDLYQGVAGLVLKLGPRCYEDSDVMTWKPPDKMEEGDWVLIRRGDGGGFRVRLNGVDCILFDNERGLKARVQRPDCIF